MRLCLRFALFLMIGDLATCALSAPRAPQEATDYASHFNHGQELFKQMRFHEATAEFRAFGNPGLTVSVVPASLGVPAVAARGE